MSAEDAIDNSELVPAPRNSIVVGHDGSDYADDALGAALELADQLHVPVLVVRAWSIATAPRPANWDFGYVSSFDEYSAAVHDELVRDTRTAVKKYPAVSVSYRAVHASPAQSLIDLSRDVRLLVVGTRGRGGLAGMLLGSVSEQCVRHAACPVLVVRPRT
ncbi:universal stress protein [Cryobacterium tagatosivorans]|uniref:Universal stress protein n=1 Tax=Cryobacterium tagatosivorans TaxID=1259199 RepID=A0A4R8UGI7_9MICO|nr:universal stress protein [Cryobacterium tagatosivorans]TFB54770.1 universal stress protein [Cryobacterium tagatosivorans]